jgi:hypothetical protein
VGPRVGMEVVAERKKEFCPCRESNPGRPARSLVTILTELSQLPARQTIDVIDRIFCCPITASHSDQSRGSFPGGKAAGT